MTLYTVIMAGGSGTRLWPISRRLFPKQVVPFLGGASLFARVLARLAPLAPPERTLVITTASQIRLLRPLAAKLPKENVIAEPAPRDSAAAILLAASIIHARTPGAVMFAVPADHMISPDSTFRNCVSRAVRLARDGRLMVTFGVKPTHPATRYGYIERGAPIAGAKRAFHVKRFHEKPDARTAKRYLRKGGFYWNSGMFAWRASTILQAAAAFAPEHHSAISPLGPLCGKTAFASALKKAYRRVKKISIDYAVMEKAPNIAMIEADFQWNDVGSPIALRECAALDPNGNYRQGLTELLDSSDCTAVTDDRHLLAVFGCESLVVVHTPDATLVCPARHAEQLKRLIAVLESRKELEGCL